jgi:hypothetical protein
VRKLRLLCAMLAIGAFLVVGAGTAGAGSGTTCSGVLAPGTYKSVTVTGLCSLPDSGVVEIRGGLTVAPGAIFNGVTDAKLTVSGGIAVGSDAVLGLGCSPSAGCDITTFDRIDGGIRASQPLAALIHGNIIRGGIELNGGGGGANCNSGALFGGPPFTAIEDNTVSGGITVANQRSCWLGLFRNTVRGSVSVLNNVMDDPDANEVAANVISGNLACFGNSPAAQLGLDVPPAPNTVSGRKLGQCSGL